jgi:hypothetical protein
LNQQLGLHRPVYEYGRGGSGGNGGGRRGRHGLLRRFNAFSNPFDLLQHGGLLLHKRFLLR